MSNGSGQENAGDPPRAQPAQEERSTLRQEPVHLKSPRSLERLRDRVRKAVQELERLRQENAALTQRIEELETRPAVAADGTLLAFDEDSEALRAQVERFIQTIDAYLATETN